MYAIRQAIAKSLVAYYAKNFDAASALELRQLFIAYDRTLLIADPRRMEPKKFGGHGARARSEWGVDIVRGAFDACSHRLLVRTKIIPMIGSQSSIHAVHCILGLEAMRCPMYLLFSRQRNPPTSCL